MELSGIYRNFILSAFRSYSTLIFSTSPSKGFLLFLVTMFSPKAGLCGLLGIFFSNLIAFFLKVDRERISKGLYGFNGLLVGLSFSMHYELDASLVLILLAASMMLVCVTLTLEHMLSYFLGLPVLSIPFVIISISSSYAFFNYHSLTHSNPFVLEFDKYFPEINRYLMFYLKSLGGIFFQSSPWAGLAIFFILAAASRISLMLSIIGFSVGIGFHILLLGDSSDLNSGIIGFNCILTAIAVGGVFLVPSPHTFVFAGLAAACSALFASFAKIFFVQFNIPVLAAPFATMTLLFLYTAKLLRNQNLHPVDFLPGSPESNLNYFRTRQSRFGLSGFYIRLPFSGKWKISQGYDGKFTHKEQWRESLDFMAADDTGKVRKGAENSVKDFYTFGLPVLAPAAGRVIKVVSHLEDSKLGEADTKNNWGNMVLIEHSLFLYSQLSHLQQNSVLVKEGDYVNAGVKLACAGNSGRSFEPHIHLHFQKTPEIGSPTCEAGFSQYLNYNDNTSVVSFNSIPKENEIISHLNSDFNLKNFFTLAPGQKLKIQSEVKSSVQKEKWTVNLDLFGNRFIEDESQNRLYYITTQDYFACIDYIGRRGSNLFMMYLSLYRIPFLSIETSWKDTISYTHFSNPVGVFFKDLVSPFHSGISYDWFGSIRKEGQAESIHAEVIKSGVKIFESQCIPGNSAFPGKIKVSFGGKECSLSIIE